MCVCIGVGLVCLYTWSVYVCVGRTCVFLCSCMWSMYMCVGRSCVFMCMCMCLREINIEGPSSVVIHLVFETGSLTETWSLVIWLG